MCRILKQQTTRWHDYPHTQINWLTSTHLITNCTAFQFFAVKQIQQGLCVYQLQTLNIDMVASFFSNDHSIRLHFQWAERQLWYEVAFFVLFVCKFYMDYMNIQLNLLLHWINYVLWFPYGFRWCKQKYS